MTDSAPPLFDIAIVGGGINGAGIARDAAGRGLRVVLLEKDDLAAHTSSWSTKLIHGGLRYLEYYEFRLVAESLAEREVLLAAAPHIISPLQFVLPHEPHLRPAWMIRAGLLLYDHLGGRRTLPASFKVKLTPDGWGAGLKAQFKTGFVYSDARVDDARLVVVNAIDARERGADIRTRTEMLAARRVDGVWELEYRAASGEHGTLRARALVNAAGPWVARVHDEAGSARGKDRVRHVKGSHIVVPRVHTRKHAYILQSADQRIVFIIPFQDAFSLIGTTDIAVDEYEHPRISAEEVDYLCAIAGAYLEHPVTPADIVWTYSGVRPLYDDGASDPAAVTRDYVLKLEAERGRAPLLSIFGGKITTYRRLAEAVLAELAPYFAGMRPPWTRGVALPGGDMASGIADYGRELSSRYPGMPASLLEALLHRHGTRTPRVLGEARSTADLGAHFGDTLYAAEIDYCMREEWARDGEDLLWRRTKCGLHLDAEQREAVAAFMRARVR